MERTYPEKPRGNCHYTHVSVRPRPHETMEMEPLFSFFDDAGERRWESKIPERWVHLLPESDGLRDGAIHERKHFTRLRLRQLPHEISGFIAYTPSLDGDNSVCGRIRLSFTCLPQNTSQSLVFGQLRSTEGAQIFGQHFDSPFV